MWFLLIIGAYLLGSIPFGVMIARSRGVDITKHGSGNIGATNVGRVLGKRLGLLCFVLDLGKGAAPVLVAGWLTGALGE
ncbi:MAG: glycerol-3-phosphate acyltransferase, partial [Phycisphaerae bacterium]|nr:glycerol-3-phosphate acyltransferase [Phycisphaerae bacterium]